MTLQPNIIWIFYIDSLKWKNKFITFCVLEHVCRISVSGNCFVQWLKKLRVHILRLSKQRHGGSPISNNLMNYTPELNRPALVIIIFNSLMHTSITTGWLYMFFLHVYHLSACSFYASVIHVYWMSFHYFISNCRKKGYPKWFLEL